MRIAKTKLFTKSKILRIFWFCCLFVFFILAMPRTNQAQEGKKAGQEIGVRGFLDEDGDGFNDLLPDRDGDGVPDALDPDMRGQRTDSTLFHHDQNPTPDSGGMMHHGMDGGFMDPHGEPGMFGPEDSLRHGGMGGMDPWHHHHGMDPDDTTGHGWNPDSTGHHHGGWPPDDSTGWHGPKPGKSGGDISPVKDQQKLDNKDFHINHDRPTEGIEQRSKLQTK